MDTIITIICFIACLPALLWCLIWTIGIFAGSVHAAKHVKDNLESKGTPKPLAIILAIGAGIVVLWFMGWLFNQSAYYNGR